MAVPEKTRAVQITKKTGVWGNLQKYCQKNTKIDVPILQKIQKRHNTYIYVIGLPDANLPLGLQGGQHIKIYAKVPTKKKPQGEVIERMYSPASPEGQLGTFELQFKVYRKGTHSKYPEGGAMSQYLESKNVGDKITIWGPLIGFWYAGPGHFQIATIAHMTFKNLGMICGGTGINVMYPVIQSILSNPADKTNVTLLYANNSDGDILLKEELARLPADPRLKIYYTVSQTPIGWTGYEGRVTKDMITKIMPPPTRDTFMWVCGPVDMDKAVERQLFDLKYKKSRMMVASDLGYFGFHVFRSVCCCKSN